MTIMTLHKCVGCNEFINDMYHLIVGSNFYWHLSCLKCSECSCSLQTKCYLNNGKFYCQTDYTKLKTNSNKTALETLSSKAKQLEKSTSIVNCPTCHLAINSNDYVIKLKNEDPNECGLVYHLNCFLCNECHKLIAPGHQYAIVNQRILCSQHYLTHISMINHSSNWSSSNNNSSNNANQKYHYHLNFQNQMAASQNRLLGE